VIARATGGPVKVLQQLEITLHRQRWIVGFGMKRSEENTAAERRFRV